MVAKTHHSALAIVPADELRPAIDAIRLRHDRQVHRWMPHVNVVYPFVPRTSFDAAEPAVREACAIDPFELELSLFHVFAHRPGRFTIWLAPEPAAPIRMLAERLRERLPGYDDLFRHGGCYTPHLSVGQATSRTLADELAASWQPLRFTARELCFLRREGDRPFVVERRVPLLPTPRR